METITGVVGTGATDLPNVAIKTHLKQDERFNIPAFSKVHERTGDTSYSCRKYKNSCAKRYICSVQAQPNFQRKCISIGYSLYQCPHGSVAQCLVSLIL